MKRNSESFVRPVRDGERGQSLVIVGVMLVALLAMAALVIDLGVIYFSYQELVAATDAAALAGGAAIPAGTAQTTAMLYSAAPGDLNHHANLNVTSTNVSVSLTCVQPSTYPNLGLPPCTTYSTAQGSINVIQVTETATVPTFFAKIFGVKSVPISATATASAKGGGAPPYHIMMVLDTTASMGSGSDSGCINGSKTNLTPEQCAQEGIQTLLSELDPCPTTLTSCGTANNGVYPNSVDEVGLMVFPGLCSVALVKGSCPTASSVTSAAGPTALDDYGCPPSNPSTTSYNNDPAYLVLPLQSNYRTSDISALSTGTSGADLVKAVGAVTDGSCTGVGTPGGQGTFYAGAIDAAQAYLAANSTTGTQNVIVLLSDGDATSTASQLAGKATSYLATNECHEAVTAANNAKAAGTLIYSVSYGSETSGCTANGESGITPCQTMQGIASLPLSQYFFSVPQTIKGVTSTVCANAVPITQLSQVFTTIAGDLTSSRLVPNSTF